MLGDRFSAADIIVGSTLIYGMMFGMIAACMPSEPPLAGGWTPVDENVEGVREAEAFALDAIYRVAPVRRVLMQTGLGARG